MAIVSATQLFLTKMATGSTGGNTNSHDAPPAQPDYTVTNTTRTKMATRTYVGDVMKPLK